MCFETLKTKVLVLLNDKSNTIDDRLTQVCHLLKDSISYYNWVGFYFNNGNKQELKLHCFAGTPTEHTTIPFGKGICGQVALSNKNFVVPDVTKQNNYIACSTSVVSEIVVPIFVNGKNKGQIDIDSHASNPFTENDERFLEFVCQHVGKLIATEETL